MRGLKNVFFFHALPATAILLSDHFVTELETKKEICDRAAANSQEELEILVVGKKILFSCPGQLNR